MGNVCIYILHTHTHICIYYIYILHIYIYLYPRDFHRTIYVDIPSGDQSWFAGKSSQFDEFPIYLVSSC